MGLLLDLVGTGSRADGTNITSQALWFSQRIADQAGAGKRKRSADLAWRHCRHAMLAAGCYKVGPDFLKGMRLNFDGGSLEASTAAQRGRSVADGRSTPGLGPRGVADSSSEPQLQRPVSEALPTSLRGA